MNTNKSRKIRFETPEKLTGPISQRLILWLVILMAISLMVFLARDYVKDGVRLRELRQELETSQASWKKTAAEKEALQDELAEAQDALREAELTLQESTEKAAAVREEIAVLEKEIEALREKQPASAETAGPAGE